VTIKYFDMAAPWGPIDLPFSVLGLTITVGAGKFDVVGTEYELPEDNTYDVEPDQDHDLWLSGYLVRDKASGDVFVLVEAVTALEIPYPLQSSESPYRELFLLFDGCVPPRASSLDDAELTVRRLTKIEDPEAGD
jgi:hypothetical protein